MSCTGTLHHFLFIGLLSVSPLEATRAQQADTIPFTLTEHNNIIVPVVLNAKDTLRLMFHSAFNGVALTREGLQRCPSITIDGEGTAESWAGTAASSVSRNNHLRIGQQHWDSLMFTIDEQSGPGSDGKFGYDLFANRLVEIDPVRQIMVLHDVPPTTIKGLPSIPLLEEHGSLYVEASLALKDSARTDRFMLHSGYGGTCILGNAFMQGSGITALDTLGVKKLSDSFGNELRNVSVNAGSIQLGATVFRAVRVQVMDPRSRFPVNVIGGDLLKRFHWVLDLPGKRLYLQPNELMGTAFSERF